MTILVFPGCACKTPGQKHYLEELQAELPSIRSTCLNIFRDNSVRQRAEFFGDPLIQILWKMFVQESPETTLDYLRQLRSTPMTGE